MIKKAHRLSYRKDHVLTCEGCGEKFITTEYRQRFCSRVCGWQHRRLTQSEKDFFCEECNSPFKALKHAKFCSTMCSQKARERQKTEVGPFFVQNKVYQCTCTVCDRVFKTKTATRKYCDLQCQNFFNKHRKHLGLLYRAPIVERVS